MGLSTHAFVAVRRLPCGEGFFTCDRNRISKKSNGDEHECEFLGSESTGAGSGWAGGSEHTHTRGVEGLRRETHASVTMRKLPCGEGFFTCDRNRISKKSNGDEHECGLDSLEAGARALDTGAGSGWDGGDP